MNRTMGSFCFTEGVDAALREYRRTDLDAIVDLDAVCFAPELLFDRASMRRFAEARNAVTVVAEGEQGSVAGFVIVHVEQMRSGKRGYLLTLDVAHAYRRKGVARHLLRTAEERAEAAGAHRMDLHVFTENESAIYLYEAAGYERTAVRRAFYGAGRDAYVYGKLLQPRSEPA